MGAAGIEGMPLRPMTIGELLDTAISLLRRCARRLLPLAGALAAAEQLLLYPLRQLAAVHPPWYFPPYIDRLAPYWLMLVVGLGAEATILTVLGARAARASVPALVGDAAPAPGGRPAATAALALLTGAGALLCAAALGLPWIVWFLFTGLGAPVLIVDRQGTPGSWPAPGAAPRPLGVFASLARGMGLVRRGGGRPGGIRLLGYLGWWVIRLALGTGGVALLMLVVRPGNELWMNAVAMIAAAAANAVAYAALGCLDAVLHLENRIRIEGLDLALTRALRQPAGVPPGAASTPVQAALAVPR